MGQFITKTFIGAYFKANVSKNEFKKTLNENGFFEDYYDENDEYVESELNENCNNEMFENPYEGLEDFTILLPVNHDDETAKKYCLYNNYQSEIEINIAYIDKDLLVVNLLEDYEIQYLELQKWFGDKISIVVGVVCYFDEIA